MGGLPFRGDTNKAYCGLHFDLPSTEWFGHGQILITIEEDTTFSIFKQKLKLVHIRFAHFPKLF